MKIAILTANLGKFDSVNADSTYAGVGFHRWTDENFPPITGLTPRLQYRIPKLFGWQMHPGYDIYIWLDGSMSLQHNDSMTWLLEQLGNNNMLFFKHPWRRTVQEEVDHIEQYLQKGNKYITSRYKNGLHKEFLKDYPEAANQRLLASTVFVYRNKDFVQQALKDWWLLQSRYYTCDQVQLPQAISFVPGVKIMEENIFKTPYISLTSKHK